MQFLVGKISILAATIVPKWTQNGDQNPGIPRTLRANLPRRLQGGQMEAKELENGTKMEPEWDQDGTPVDSQGIQHRWDTGSEKVVKV